MDFSWGRATEVALVGFGGVFTILVILSITVTITSRLVRLFSPKPVSEKDGEIKNSS